MKTARVIAIDGNIGAGKSTLCARIKSSHPRVRTCDEPVHRCLLKQMYTDPMAYAFTYQWGMLLSRIHALELAIRDGWTNPRDEPGTTLLLDRSIIGDRVFAIWNYFTGKIKPKEMNIYQSMYFDSIEKAEILTNSISASHVNILLIEEPAECKRRVDEERKNAEEIGIPLEYYEGLDDVQFNLFVLDEKRPRTIFMHRSQYLNGTEIMDVIAAIDEREICLPTIGFYSILPEAKPDDIFYLTDESVMKKYDEIKRLYQRTVSDVYLKPRSDRLVTFNKKIMHMSPQEKGADPDRIGRFIFYRPEFKAVVYWHLTGGDSIAFI